MVTMNHYLYFFFLLLAISGIFLAGRPLLTKKDFLPVALSVGVFLVFDLLGVYFVIFSTNQAWVTGINLGNNNLPLEEVFFLIVLSMLSLVFFRFFSK